MAAVNYLSTVEKCYLAYYGRTADVEGAAYWSHRLEKAGGNLSEIIDAFANSDESRALYGNLDTSSKINKIYQQVFGRDADPTGLEFYSEALSSQRLSQGSIALDILNGAQGDDASYIQVRVDNAISTIDIAQFNSLAESFSRLIPSDLSGNYNLVAFDLYYDNGFHFDEGDVYSFSGYMNIKDNGLLTQVMSLNGRSATSSQYVEIIDEDTMLTSYNGVSYFIDYMISGDNLTLRSDTSQIGLNYIEYDYWQYMA